MNITELLSHKWEYRGEGNANVAIGLPNIQKILRIPKSEKPTTIIGWIINWLKEVFRWNCQQDIEHERRNLDFYNLVMIPLFGETFTKPAMEIRTYPRIINKLAREIIPFQPVHRQSKKLQVWIASLLTDYTILPKQLSTDCLEGATFSIEIKPKQGWIHINERLNNKCLYCSHQLVKLKRGEIKELSLYCPLDLFSGDKVRMLKALKALTCTPQNNFKVFKNGCYCFGEGFASDIFENILCEMFGHSSSYSNRLLDNFCFLLQQSVVKNFQSCNGTECNFTEELITELTKADMCLFEQSSLPEGCVLERILNVQKLNRLGLSKYADMYNELQANGLKIEKWSYIEKFLEKESCKEFLQNQSLSEVNLVPYLLATIAYDCSFMVTLRRLKNISKDIDASHIITVGKHNFLINIGVFDLYPKPANTIMKHVKRHREILSVGLTGNQRLFF